MWKASLLVVLVGGCVSSTSPSDVDSGTGEPPSTEPPTTGPVPDAGMPDPLPAEPVEAADAFDGDFVLVGTWDLGGPLSGDRSSADALAELIIAEAVARSGLPSPLHAEAEEQLRSVVADGLAASIEEELPGALQEDGWLSAAMATSLARTEVESELALEIDAETEALTGVETFLAVRVPVGSEMVDIPVDRLTPEGTAVSARWSGEVSDGALDVDPHEVELRYERLVVELARVMGVDLVALQARAASELSCDVMVAALFPDGTVAELDLGVTTQTVRSDLLVEACDAATVTVTDELHGLLGFGTTIEVGGTVLGWDSNRNGLADQLTSVEGFGGTYTNLPAPLTPRVQVDFTGIRQ